MLDVKFLAANYEQVEEIMKNRSGSYDVKIVHTLDLRRKEILREVESLKAARNKVSEQIAALKREKKNADALILVTEWKEFRQPDFEEIVKLLKQPVIFDGRNQYDKKRLAERGIEYYQIGVG